MYQSRFVGAAGIAFVVLAGLENLDFPAAASRTGAAAYDAAHPTAARLTAAAGLLALVAYATFVIGLLPMLRRPLSGLAAATGVAGPLVAAAALTARLRADHALAFDLRLLGGALLGVTLLAVGLSGRRFPVWLRGAAVAVGAAIVIVSAAAFALSSPVPDALAHAGYATGTVCVATIAVLLLLPERAGFAATLAWLVFFVVAVAAGVSGLALLAVPDATGTFFSWPLGPPPLAATIGGCYVVATVVYGAALRAGGPARRPLETRTLLVGVCALSVPVFAVSLHHLEAFDFTDWQAWAWIVLFGLFPLAAVTALRPAPGPVQRPGRPARVYGLVLVAAAAALLADPSLAAGLPVAGGPFGVRVLAGWFVFAAALALQPATGPARAGMLLFPVVWLLAPLSVTTTGLTSGGTAFWCAAAVALVVLAAASGRGPAPHEPSTAGEGDTPR